MSADTWKHVQIKRRYCNIINIICIETSALEKLRELQGHTTYDSITSIAPLARLDDILNLMWMKTRL